MQDWWHRGLCKEDAGWGALHRHRAAEHRYPLLQSSQKWESMYGGAFVEAYRVPGPANNLQKGLLCAFNAQAKSVHWLSQASYCMSFNRLTMALRGGPHGGDGARSRGCKRRELCLRLLCWPGGPHHDHHHRGALQGIARQPASSQQRQQPQPAHQPPGTQSHSFITRKRLVMTVHQPVHACKHAVSKSRALLNAWSVPSVYMISVMPPIKRFAFARWWHRSDKRMSLRGSLISSVFAWEWHLQITENCVIGFWCLAQDDLDRWPHGQVSLQEIDTSTLQNYSVRN